MKTIIDSLGKNTGLYFFIKSEALMPANKPLAAAAARPSYAYNLTSSKRFSFLEIEV